MANDTNTTQGLEDEAVEPMAQSGIEPTQHIVDDEPKFNTIKAQTIPLKYKLILIGAALVVTTAMYLTLKSSLDSPTKDMDFTSEVEAPFLQQEESTPNINIDSSVDAEIDLFNVGTTEDDVNAEDKISNDESLSNAIVISPPLEEEIKPDQSSANGLDASIEIDILTSKINKLEERDTKRAEAVKTSIEIQTQSLNRLTGLMSKLDGLKVRLDTLTAQSKTSVKAIAPVEKKKVVSASSRATQINQAKPLSRPMTLQARLVGTDMWGGDRFAQIDYKGTIHLLGVGEAIDTWTITAIGNSQVTMQNKNGEINELTN